MINTIPYRPQTSTRQDSASISGPVEAQSGQRRPPPFLAFLAALAPFLARFPVAVAPSPSPERLGVLWPWSRSCLFVFAVGAALIGSSGHGCFGYLPRISARTEAYAPPKNDGRSCVVVSGAPRGERSSSTTATRRRSGPIRGVSVAPNHSCSLMRRAAHPLRGCSSARKGRRRRRRSAARRGCRRGRQLGGCRRGQGRLELIRQRLVEQLGEVGLREALQAARTGVEGGREPFLRTLDEALLGPTRPLPAAPPPP